MPFCWHQQEKVEEESNMETILHAQKLEFIAVSIETRLTQRWVQVEKSWGISPNTAYIAVSADSTLGPRSTALSMGSFYYQQCYTNTSDENWEISIPNATQIIQNWFSAVQYNQHLKPSEAHLPSNKGLNLLAIQCTSYLLFSNYKQLATMQQAF
jgi:hypothetical protein